MGEAARAVLRLQAVTEEWDMGVIRWMSAEGDTQVVWDETDAPSMDRAREMIDRAFREGRGVFSLDADGVGVRLRQFDPSAREIVVIPQIKGG
jgi:hypothetical protein